MATSTTVRGGAVGTLRCSSGKTNVIAFSVVQPHRLEVLKAALNACVAEERILTARETNRDGTSLQNGFYTHRGQVTGPLAADRG